MFTPPATLCSHVGLLALTPHVNAWGIWNTNSPGHGGLSHCFRADRIPSNIASSHPAPRKSMPPIYPRILLSSFPLNPLMAPIPVTASCTNQLEQTLSSKQALKDSTLLPHSASPRIFWMLAISRTFVGRHYPSLTANSFWIHHGETRMSVNNSCVTTLLSHPL